MVPDGLCRAGTLLSQAVFLDADDLDNNHVLGIGLDAPPAISLRYLQCEDLADQTPGQKIDGVKGRTLLDGLNE
jgi:hypothetical protein